MVGSPRVVLLDEPAAGLPDEETAQLRVIQNIAEVRCLVILVDHDMSLVSSCCETAAVLDFGKLIASGPTAEVMRNEHVIRAYLGTEEGAVSEPAGPSLQLDGLTVARGGGPVVRTSRSRFRPLGHDAARRERRGQIDDGARGCGLLRRPRGQSCSAIAT